MKKDSMSIKLIEKGDKDEEQRFLYFDLFMFSCFVIFAGAR